MTESRPNDELQLFDPRVESTLERLGVELASLDSLKRVERLKRELSVDLARAATGLLELRLRAKRKFEEPDRAWLTRKGLEQATPLAVARDRARQIAAFDDDSVVHDATCGLGADALALVRAGVAVIASDLDATTTRCAARNLAGGMGRSLVVQADALHPTSRAPYLLLDPDRRPAGERVRSAERMMPTFAQALALAAERRGACIKLPPGFELGLRELDALGSKSWRASWSSSRGEVVELALWLGEWADSDAGTHEARIVGASADSATLVRRLGSSAAARREVEPWTDADLALQAWLVEPDGAAIRAGLVGELARDFGLRPVGPEIAYLAGPRPPDSPWYTAWPIIEGCQADPRRVRELLLRHDVGAVHVRKRGHPDTAEILARRFAGRGRRPGHLAVARTLAGHRAFLLGDAPERVRLVGDEGFEPPASSL